MNTHPISAVREVLACLICSKMYFDLRPQERLALVKSLAAELTDRTKDVCRG